MESVLIIYYRLSFSESGLPTHKLHARLRLFLEKNVGLTNGGTDTRRLSMEKRRRLEFGI